jgi:hypothetical protein
MGFTDAMATTARFFQFTIGGPLIKMISGVAGFAFRNAGDTADVPITTSRLNNSGSSLILNSGAANSYGLSAPTTGQTGPKNVTLPSGASVAGYAVVALDSIDTWGYTPLPISTDKATDKTYAIAFNSQSSINLAALPAGAIAKTIIVFIDTPWSGYTSTPTLSIGLAGNTSAFMATNQIDLTDAIGAKSYQVNPSVAASGSISQMIASYVANGATAGAGRIIVNYSIPSTP